MKKIPALIFLFLFNAAGFSQEAGRPFIRNYPPPEYRASQQNWSVTQDSRGIMYFGNNDGLLEFDGINWRLTKLPIVRTIAIDSTGRIFVGLENDMGFLEPGPGGGLQYQSLKDKLPEAHRDLTTVLYVYILGNKVIFLADEKLFIHEGDKVTVLTSAEGFHHMFVVRNRLYVRERGKGLLYLEGDSLRFIEGSEGFATERVYSMLPFGTNDVLISTRTQGALVYAPQGPEKFIKPKDFEEVDEFLLKNPVYCGTVLSNGNIALGALTGGIIIFNEAGKVINRYNKDKGLQDNTIYWLYADRNQQLWATQDNGISLIPVNLPFRSYTEQDGLNGSPMCLAFFDQRFYVGTAQYLHIQDSQGRFRPVAGTEGQNFQLMEANGTLLLAGYQGVFDIRGDKAVPLNDKTNVIALTFCPLRNRPDRLLLGTSDEGFYLMEYERSSWKLKHHIKGFEKSVYVAVEDLEGNIWVSTAVDLYKLRINDSKDSVTAWRQCTMDQGLPRGNFAMPYALNSGEVVFGTLEGVYRYDETGDKFIPHPDFGMLSGKIMPLVQMKNGDIWFEELQENGDYKKGVLWWRNGSYVAYSTPFYKFIDIRCYEGPFTITTAPDGTIFIATSSGLLQYDPLMEQKADRPFNTLIRNVSSKGSPLYEGEDLSRKIAGATEEVVLPFRGNDLTFDFASTFYEDPEKNLYSYRLVGYDTAWSGWASDHKKEYTNIREGSYTFEVRSRNQYRTAGIPASYSFRILPPWYRTWWAYLAFAVIAGLAVYMLIYFRTRQLRERSQELEKTVEKRTAQIQDLSRIGRDITSSLSIENIIHTIYENVNNLMDASVFSIGIHKPEGNALEFPATIEKNRLLPSFSVSLSDESRLSAWCFNNHKDVVINDYPAEYSRYLRRMPVPMTSENPESVLCIPLWNKGKVIGVITAQSFSKNAYTDYHLNMLRNLATYSAIAIENADAFRRLAALFNDLKAAQERLVTQSKLAALGELTAGIAHEIQNPLNFVNNFSELNRELIQEMKGEMESGNLKEAKALAGNIADNEEKIIFHGKRADGIVKGMLQHSRGNSGVKEPTDINALADEFLRLAYHGLRAKDKTFNAKMNEDFDESIGRINVVPQDIGRAILNLITNAFYAVTERKKLGSEGYEPVVTISTRKLVDKVEIKVSDNGGGIPPQVMDKIFQPFYTTKPAGQGTGLGLSLCYDIVTKGHGGELLVDTVPGEGSTFIIHLPVHKL